jgi:hypothetical protein
VPTGDADDKIFTGGTGTSASEIYHSETLSTFKGNDGKFGLEEKTIKTDFKL